MSSHGRCRPSLAMLLISGALAGADAALAQPAMSRGQQFLPISHEECLSRAEAALRAAGYTLWSSAGNGPWGYNGPHAAVIFCEPTGNREVVDIAVATEGSRDGNVPGVERVRLQELMESGAPPEAVGGGNCPNAFRDRADRAPSLTCYCSATAVGTDLGVWGTDVYTEDSTFCRAARHAGAVGPGGGMVTGVAAPGQSGYQGSERNGVTTRPYGSYGGSVRFGDAPPTSQVADCPTNATSLRGTGQRLSCWCSPQATTSGSVWGTDVYTDDSTICRAALHAGAVTSGGGSVTIRTLPGLDGYSGSNRRGVATSSYARWHGSYRFE